MRMITTSFSLTLALTQAAGVALAQQAPVSPPAPMQASGSTQPAPAPNAPSTPIRTSGEIATAPERLDERDWSVRITPRAWFVAPAGDLELPGVGGQTVTLDTLNLDSTRIQPAGQVDLQSERWMIALGGSTSSSETVRVARAAFQLGSTSVAAGQAFNASFDYTTVQALVGYRLWEYNLDAQKTEDAGDTRLRFFVLGGARLHDVEASIERPGVAGTRSESSLTTVSLIASTRLQLMFARDFSIEVDLSAGGLHDSSTFDINACISYQPVDWFAAQFGYRHLEVSAQSGSGSSRFQWDGSVAGIYAGVIFKF